ncbi:Tyrosine-protein kinase Fer [Toxocara canis]|uniref:Tyrosine-protein kinase n=1 Tax=Toxocara canis TaxID=6265 RepID=A0A0B2V6U4_TOXCA|nr:Tyrosine-protein kinase Fer [Toxocara canis]
MHGVSKKVKGKLLEAQEWYIGLLTRTAVECYLKKEGDFVVRTSEKGGALEFVVSVRGLTKCAHYTVYYEDDAGWGLNLDHKKEESMHMRYPNCEKKGEDLQNAEKAKESLIQEGSLMAEYRHPNIIKFYGICCDRPPVCVVMERCYGGSLLAHLEKFGNEITTGERIRYCLEAAMGMSYLQDRKCIHRDLAARNCLISKFGVIKIADFGLSKVVTELAGEKFENQQVPVRWMAPETLKRDPEYSLKSDVWAYGMLLFEVYNNGGKPWPDWEPKRIATHIRKGRMIELPDRAPKSIKELVNDCWQLNVAQRCDFKHIVRKLNVVQLQFPPPRPEKSTIARIPQVTAMSMQEMEVLLEQEETDDEALDEAHSLSEEGRRQDDPERDATIEEVAVKRTPRRMKKHRDGEKMKKDKKAKKALTSVMNTRNDDTDKTKQTSEDTDEMRRKATQVTQDSFKETPIVTTSLQRYSQDLERGHKKAIKSRATNNQ